MKLRREKQLPETVYVKRENVGSNEEFLIVEEDIHAISSSEKETVGVYILQKTVKAKLVTEVTEN